ncbi:MAG: hypothetical protein QG632_667 [Candidatus Dependentiae bacterium]|nr:hypothetical protein [Candidatus Dependentiae bacterium]
MVRVNKKCLIIRHLYILLCMNMAYSSVLRKPNTLLLRAPVPGIGVFRFWGRERVE